MAAPDYIVEWVMNSRQADRIFNQIELLDEYVTKRATLHQPIDRFLALANEFLKQTKKKVKVSPRGNLRVSINDAEVDHPLFALSSGERQLVVMLAHLSLNKRLAESGVFIVDEPELSLHISWQEQFVDAIQKANPKVQLILATHAPAIILERIDNCRSLS
jgi:predicted ATPase